MESSRLSLEKAVEEKFIKGSAHPLQCPPSYIIECNGSGSGLPEEDMLVSGFAFSWGQLLEIERDGVMTWEVRFEKLHRDFLDFGIPSRELSDRFLDSVIGLDIPEFLVFKKGSLRSTAASIILTDASKETAAREYLITEFLRGNSSPMNTIVRAIRRSVKANRGRPG